MRLIERVRRNPAAWAMGIGAALVVAVLLFGFVQSRLNSSQPPPSTAGLSRPGTPPAVPGHAGQKPGSSQAGKGGPKGGNGGWSSRGRSHTVVLSVTSAKSTPARIGWKVRTGPRTDAGKASYSGTSWSHTAKIHWYAGVSELFVISSGGSGVLTCTIRMDGRVVSQHSTSGHPYSSAMCVG